MGALEKAFELSVVVSAVDKFTGPFKKAQQSLSQTQKDIDTVTKAMKSMGKSSDEINKVTSSIEKLDRDRKFQALAKDLKAAGMGRKDIQDLRDSIDKLEESRKRVESLTQSFDKFKKTAIVGGVITGFGVKMAEGLAKATEQAGKLLTTLTTIQSATGASNGQMDKIYGTIKSTSAVTKYDIPTTAKLGGILSTSGYNAQETQSLLPVFTKLAEVQEFGKGAAPEETVKKAIELAHGFGKYSPEELNSFLNNYNKATFLQPEDSEKFGETLKYTMTQGKALGLNDNDILYTAALSNRMGLAGSMGGTNAADMLLRAIPGISGGLKQKKDGSYPKQLQAMMEAGLSDKNGNSPFFDKNGKITNLPGFIDTLYTKTANLDPKKKALLYHDIFGQQGMRPALLFGSKQGQEQLAALHAGMNRIHSIDQMQHDYNQTPEGQVAQLQSNLQNLKFSVFLEMAKSMNPLLKNLNQLVEKMIQFSDQHPKIAQFAASFLAIGTAALLVAGPITSLIGLLGMLRTGLTRFGILKGMEKGAPKVDGSTGFLGKMFGIGDTASVGSKLAKGLKVAGPLSLLSAGYDVYKATKESGSFRKGISQRGGSIVGSAVGGTLGAAVGSLVGPAGTVIGGMAGSAIGGKLGGMVDQAGWTEKLVDGTVSAWNKLKSSTTSTFNAVSNKIKGFMNNTEKWFDDFPKHVGYGVGFAVGWMKQLPGNAEKYFSDLYQSADKWTTQTIKDIEKWWQQLPENTEKSWNNTWQAVDKWASNTYSSAVGWAQKTYSDVINWFKEIPDKISGFFKSAGGWIDGIEKKAKGVLNGLTSGFDAGYQASGAQPHAKGGIFTKPHLGLVAEAGAEAIIPLTNRQRGLELWQQTGRMLGVQSNQRGSFNRYFYNQDESTGQTYSNRASSNTQHHYHDESSIVIHPGAIVIHQQTGESDDKLAKRVLRIAGKYLRNQGYRTGSQPRNAW